MTVEQEIKDRAVQLGFDAVGITDASPIGPEHVGHLKAWLQAGYAGCMEYMHRNLAKRIDPARLRRGARSVIVVALNYKRPSEQATASKPQGVAMAEHPLAPPTHDAHAPSGRVALYAQYEDYHPFIKSLLQELTGFLSVRTGRTERFKICVDSAPVAEKALAVRAGLGFIGKNHLLIHPQLGPQILLGELVTTVDLRRDGPVEGECLDCNACVNACPTGALRPDGLLDARRCVSYLTQYGPQDKTAQNIGSWLFGCDECLLACPFYENAPACANRRFRVHPDRARLDLRELLDTTCEAFEATFHDSPIRAAGLARLKRNARACLRNVAPT